jgi:fructose-bisphosphate aldolase, class II
MPLVSIGPVLKHAQAEHYAVPLFDAFDSISIDGIFAAAEEKSAPVIVALYTGVLEHANAPALAEYIRMRAKGSPIPASLMLDHGGSFEHVVKSLTLGFTDVMYDGSKLPYEENIANTRAVVRAAHAVGIYVEAELGHVGQGSDYASFGGQRKGFTNPELVAPFITETGVDSLAIAIGNAHGVYQGEPCLDIDLLKDIRERVDIPLILHGGSGISEEQFHAAIAGGIAKINIATDLYMTAARRLANRVSEDNSKSGGNTYWALSATVVESFRERCGYYLDLFGAAGKAKNKGD